MAAKKKPESRDVMNLAPELAFNEVKPHLEKMHPDDFVKSRVDYPAVATLALSKLRTALTPKRLERLASLPEAEFDPGQLDRAVVHARALLYLAVRRDSALAIEKGALVPADVYAQGSTLKREMVRVLDYNLDDDDARKEVADIASGTGYVDLAQDLRRLADLYVRFETQLAADKKRFRSADASRASTLADRIAPQEGGGEAANWLKLCQAAWTHLEAAYRDVRETVTWLHRHDGGMPDLPALLAAMAGRNRVKADEENTPEPTPTPE
jgi:hypothetical protein